MKTSDLSDQNKKDVIAALENDKYDWRTAQGVAHDTGLPVDHVHQILAALSDDVIRSSALDARGRPLYTTRKHYKKKQNFANRLLSALSDQIK